MACEGTEETAFPGGKARETFNTRLSPVVSGVMDDVAVTGAMACCRAVVRSVAMALALVTVEDWEVNNKENVRVA